MELRKIALDILGRRGMRLAGELVGNPDVNNGMYIPLKVARISGKMRPSQKEIIYLKDELVDSGITPEFILIDKEEKSLESDLRASLLTSLPDLVRNIFVTVNGTSTEIWVDEKRHLEEMQASNIERSINKFLELRSMSPSKILYMTDQSIATNTEVLSIIRKNSPIDALKLKAYIEELNFSVPSLDWVKRKLDALRKADAVMRLPDGSYVLTAASLHKLGTRKDRHSPDVSRLLALAKLGS